MRTECWRIRRVYLCARRCHPVGLSNETVVAMSGGAVSELCIRCTGRMECERERRSWFGFQSERGGFKEAPVAAWSPKQWEQK